MLEEIRLSGLGVIDEAVLELDPGLTVVTGETGAGKTMVVTGLSLLLGGRADAGLVRTTGSGEGSSNGGSKGSRRAVVEGMVRLSVDSVVARTAIEAGAELEDADPAADGTGGLLLSRTISSEGRSRAFAGGAGIPAGKMAELTQDLVALHGQSDQIRLLRSARQRELLDRFAGESVLRPLETYRKGYARLGRVRAELAELTTRARDRAQEADLLRFGLGEVEELDPQPGEDAALAAEDARLSHADGLRTAAEQAHAALVGVDDGAVGAADALTLLAGARKQLDTGAEHDPELAALAARVAEAAALVADTGADLASYASGIDTDPTRLATVADRRAALTGLTRKYGETIDDVLEWAGHAAIRLTELDGTDDRVTELESEQAALLAELGDLAGKVSAARSEAAVALGDAVTIELKALAMPNAVLSADVSRTKPGDASDAGEPDAAKSLEVDGTPVAYGPYGIDEIEFTLTPHQGAPPRPLHRGASGGELSRVMLAVELTCRHDSPPTFVFDEVDAGVGGQAAVEIGRRLARLADTAQVIVVTHLPQVAAFADRHYAVTKTEDGSVTSSGIAALEGTERVEELARMLAGMADSATARAHAEELLETAAAERAERRG